MVVVVAVCVRAIRSMDCAEVRTFILPILLRKYYYPLGRRVGRFTSAVKVGVNEILVLGEHTIFVLRETDGELVSQVCIYACIYVCVRIYLQDFMQAWHIRLCILGALDMRVDRRIRVQNFYCQFELESSEK